MEPYCLYSNDKLVAAGHDLDILLLFAFSCVTPGAEWEIRMGGDIVTSSNQDGVPPSTQQNNRERHRKETNDRIVQDLKRGASKTIPEKKPLNAGDTTGKVIPFQRKEGA